MFIRENSALRKRVRIVRISKSKLPLLPPTDVQNDETIIKQNISKTKQNERKHRNKNSTINNNNKSCSSKLWQNLHDILFGIQKESAPRYLFPRYNTIFIIHVSSSHRGKNDGRLFFLKQRIRNHPTFVLPLLRGLGILEINFH